MKETYYISLILYVFNQWQFAFSINSKSKLGYYTAWKYGKNGGSVGKIEIHECNAAHSNYGVGKGGGVCYIIYLSKPRDMILLYNS